jgi:hypothetical protein
LLCLDGDVGIGAHAIPRFGEQNLGDDGVDERFPPDD